MRPIPAPPLAVRTVATLAAAAAAAAALAAALAGCGPKRTAAPAPTATTTTTTTATTAAPALDRGQRPPLGPAPTLTLPPATERTLPNGLRVVVVEQHELPLVDAVLVVRSGGEADPAGREGLATLTAALLDEGTATRSALAIADQAAYLGITLSTGAAWDASQVALHAPVAQLDSALALMADVVTRPSFPAADFERLKRERATGLLQLRDVGPAIADRAFAQAVFAAGHPYGRPLGGTEASTRAIGRDDVRRFYETHWRPDNATLVVVGDVTPDDVQARLARALGGWTRGSAVPAPVAPATPAAGATRVVLIDKPGAPQSSVRIGLPGVARTDPDYFPLLVMNTILGGSFTSRLNQNLRETRGYTYGAGSGLAMRRGAGAFQASAEVTGTKTDSALVEFLKELRAIADTVPTAELEKAKQYLVLQMPGDFETTGDIAGQLVPLVVYGLPLGYYDRYAQQVRAVTQADVQRVARRVVDPARLAIVVVGDRKTVEPAVRALGLGPVEVRAATAVLGAAPAGRGAGR